MWSTDISRYWRDWALVPNRSWPPRSMGEAWRSCGSNPGTPPLMRVPRPGQASIRSVPPAAATRSSRLVRPAPRSTAAGVAVVLDGEGHPPVAPAEADRDGRSRTGCLAVFWRHSRQQKERVVSPLTDGRARRPRFGQEWRGEGDRSERRAETPLARTCGYHPVPGLAARRSLVRARATRISAVTTKGRGSSRGRSGRRPGGGASSRREDSTSGSTAGWAAGHDGGRSGSPPSAVSSAASEPTKAGGGSASAYAPSRSTTRPMRMKPAKCSSMPPCGLTLAARASAALLQRSSWARSSASSASRRGRDPNSQSRSANGRRRRTRGGA